MIMDSVYINTYAISLTIMISSSISLDAITISNYHYD